MTTHILRGEVADQQLLLIWLCCIPKFCPCYFPKPHDDSACFQCHLCLGFVGQVHTGAHAHVNLDVALDVAHLDAGDLSLLPDPLLLRPMPPPKYVPQAMADQREHEDVHHTGPRGDTRERLGW